MVEQDLFLRTLNNIQNKRDRILNGKINCIPLGFKRFENELPGIERGKYYLFTANSKVGKTQITDYICLYNTIKQIIDENLDIKLKIFYFTLEIKINTNLFGYVIFFTYLCKQQK